MSGWGAELLGKYGENRPDQKECPSCMLMIDKEADMCPSCETVQPGAKAASTESSGANNDGWGDFGSGGGSSSSSSAAASADGWGDFGSSSQSASASSSSSSASSASASNSSDPWGTGAPAPAPAGAGDDPWGLGAKASSSNEGQGAGDDLWAGQPASGAGESEQQGEEQEGPSMEELLAYFVARGQNVPGAVDADTQITGAVASLLHSERSLRRAAELGAAGRPWGWGSGECDQLGMAPPPAAAASGQKGKGKAKSGPSASAASGSGFESDGDEDEDEDEDGDLYLEHAKLVPALQPEHCKEPAVFATAGGMHTVAVLADGTAVSWGCNDEGQLGRKSRGVLPQPMVGFGVPHPMAAQLSRDLSGHASAAAGTAAGRGKGRRSAASSASSSSSSSAEASQDPVYRYLLEAGRHDQLPPLDGSGKVVSVGCGDAFTVVLDSRGRVYVCGRLKGPEGRFGVSPEVQMMPFLVEVPGVRRHGRVVQVAAGYDHAVFATASGKVLTWGLGHVGQLGRPEAVMRRRSESMLAWEAVVVPLWRREAGRRKKVLAARVAAGGYSTYVLTRCGRVMATGHNHYNQLGVGVGPNLDSFQVAEALSGKGVVQLAPSKAHLLALTRAGDVIVCGRGDSGQLGLGSSSQEKAPVSAQLAEPRVIPRDRFGGEAVMQVAAGSTVSAAVTRSGRLFAWGFGDLAQLGNGAMRDEAVPFDTSKAQGGRWGGRAVLHVTIGGQHIVALVSDSAKPAKDKGPYDGAALLQASEEEGDENEAAAAHATAGRKRSRAEASETSSKPAASKRRRRG